MMFKKGLKPKVEIEKIVMTPKKDMSVEEACEKLKHLGYNIINVDERKITVHGKHSSK